MSSERTEKATPKKRQDARRKGQIPRSQKLVAALSFCVGIMVLKFTAIAWLNTATTTLQNLFLQAIKADELTILVAQKLTIEAVGAIFLLSLPVMLSIFFSTTLVSLLQGGFLFVPSALNPKMDRLNPIANAKRIFSSQPLIEMLKNLLELTFLLLACYNIFYDSTLNAPQFIGLSTSSILTEIGKLGYKIVTQTTIVMIGFAVLDYAYQWYKHEKSLRMSKQEIKDEFRQQEGDPLIKGQRRRAARALIQQRSLKDLLKADVVITNPTHFAVALQYDRENFVAPKVIAKGADLLAKRIREIAIENGISIVEEPPLARALYKDVEIGQSIPPEFFRAVAQILAYVYQKKTLYN